MKDVLTVPKTLDHRAFEALVSAWTAVGGGNVAIDARHVHWVSPYGVIGLLALGSVVRKRCGERPRLEPPEEKDVASYLTRIHFFQHAREIFEFQTSVRRGQERELDTLLEVTPIHSHQDVHAVVDEVRDRAVSIVGKGLGYPPPGVLHFSVILSEVCQNIVEHADSEGWVVAQTYNWDPKAGGKVVVIAVMDIGMGFRGSLAREHAQRYGDRWSDVTALEAAFLSGVSRYPDPGRGQGLQAIRKQMMRWNGLVTIRSGTAQIATVPDWDDTPPIVKGLPDFPGAQVQIVLPQVVPAASGGKRR